MSRLESASLLRAENLSIQGFDGREINFTLSRGSRIGVLGAPGSGKTNLLRALARLDPLSHGKLYWAKVDVSRKFLWRMKKQRNYVTLLLANPYGLFESSMTVSQLLQDSGVQAGMPFGNLLQENGIPGVVVDQPIESLSGVLRVRLGLLLVRQNASSVVLVDDVFQFLAPDVWQQIREDIYRCVGGQQALLMASRFHAGLATMDHILVMHQGRLIEGGPKQKVFDHPAHPVTRSLISGCGKNEGITKGSAVEMQPERVDGNPVQVSPGHWVLADQSEA